MACTEGFFNMPIHSTAPQKLLFTPIPYEGNLHDIKNIQDFRIVHNFHLENKSEPVD